MNPLPDKAQDATAPEKYAVICSCQFNAVGIALSLKEIGWRGRIVCLKINQAEAVIAERFPKLCECWPLQISRAEDLPALLAKRIPPAQVAAVFFCDERFLSVFGGRETAAIFPQARWRFGDPGSLDVILDRRLFYEKIRNERLAGVPSTIGSENDPWKIFGGPFRTRVWRSWRGMKKLPRGQTIHSPEELEQWKTMCRHDGVGEEEWGCQELLSTAPRDVVSVCGWHDANSQIYRVTRWLKQANENGWLVEATDDRPELQSTTRRVLEALHFAGPFELEFVRHPKSGEFQVIELNPRFWMQHRLIGNVLVRKYLGMNEVQAGLRFPADYWLNTDTALSPARLLREPAALRYFFRSVWALPVVPSLWPAARNFGRLVAERCSR